MLAHLAAEIQTICWGQQAMQLSGPYTALSSTQCSCIDPTAGRFTCCRVCRNAATRACPSGSSADKCQKHADAPHPVGLLGPRAKRPCECCAAEKCDELTPPHAMPPIYADPRVSDGGRQR